MKLIPRFTSIIRYGGLIFIILLPSQLVGQQVGSAPAISLILPSSKDSLNNSGITLVRAEIVSSVSLQTIKIFCKSLSEVIENATKPEQKDSITYIVQSRVPLKAGINTIYVEAKNIFGTASSEIRHIICQLGPFIKWLLPATVISTTGTVSEMVNIKAEIKTEYDLKNVSINLNGALFVVEKGEITQLNNSIYILEKVVKLNKSRKNNIFIIANNNKGETRSTIRVINFFLSSLPVITLVSPSATDSLINSDIVLTKAEIVSRVPLQTFRIYCNRLIVDSENTTKPEQKDSITYIVKSRVPLKAGLNTIYVEAKNNIGTASSQKRNIICQPEPIVKWLLPASVSSNVESGILNVKAEIKSGFDIHKVSLNLNGAVLASEKVGTTKLNSDTYILERTIQLEHGKNNIFIGASNNKGETRSTTRIVNYLSGSPPVITLVSPSTTDSLNNSGIVLTNAEIVSRVPLQTFRIFCNRLIVDSENTTKPEQKDSITYIVKSRVPLQAGTNIIYVDAKNIIGTASSQKRIIFCQLEPIIKWILPVSVNSSTGSGKLNINAEIITSFDLINASVNLNGAVLAVHKEEITRLNNDTWIIKKAVPLKAGVNNIFLIAGNARGTANSKERNVSYVPGIISEIEWIAPVDVSSGTYRSEFPVSASIKTGSEIRNTQLLLNGSEFISGDRSKTIRKNTREYLYENKLTLKPGTNTIELSVITGTDTITSEKRTIIYTAPTLPVLAWKNPFSDRSEVNQASLEIRMNIKSAEELENIAIYLNGKVLDNVSLLNSVKKENEDFVLGSTLILKPGDNVVYVSAGNVAGNATSETRHISYIVTLKPVIAWGNPETSISTLSAPKITIAANITSTTELKDLKIYHNGNSLPDTSDINTIDKQQGVYRVEATISLNQGENRIYIEAGNLAGNSTSETRSVNYVAPAAPVVTWVSPSRQYTNINLNSEMIRATIKSTDKLQSLFVYVNDVGSEEINQISSAGSQSEFTFEKTVNLQPGENKIYLSVTNNIGTTRSEDRYLTNPPANPPVISWAVPANPNTIVNSDLIVIEACIKSTTELKLVQIFVNGVQQASQMMFQSPQPGECNYRLTKSVNLKEGENSIRINATNFASSEWSDVRMIRFQTSSAEKRLALVFGNADYGSTNVLKNPVNDANLIEGTLKTLGFEVIKRINAKKIEMEQAIREFSEKLPEHNVALFYYAGHGIQVDGENYLIPTDAVLNKQTDCQWEAIQVNTIVRQFEQVPENINIIILDACRDNPFRSWSRGGSQGFKALNIVSGTFVSFATREGSTAADGTGFNGPFTEELVKQMVIPQSIFDVFIQTRNQVMKRTNNMQQPQNWFTLSGNFWFKR